MTLVDSSGWIEYFLDNPLASRFEKHILETGALIIPTIVTFEVYRQLIKKIDPRDVLTAITQMEKGEIIPLNQEISLFAAELSLRHRLGTADSIIYATGLIHEAKIVTLDHDFQEMQGCTVVH